MRRLSVRRAVWEITPPVALRAGKRLLDRRPEHEYVPDGFARPVTPVEPEDAVLLSVPKWEAFARAVAGTGPLAVNCEDSVESIEAADNTHAHNLLMSFAYVLARTSHKLDRISVLDWGSGLGHYYLVGGAVLPEVELEYHCRDLPAVNAHGARLLPDVVFHDDDSCLDRSYDLVLASGSLQYTEDWQSLLTRLAGASARYLYVTRMKTVESASFVVMQRLGKHGHESESLAWILNRNEIIEVAEGAGLKLERVFRLGAGWWLRDAPENPIGEEGFLFEAPGSA
jgi:putative methyltransferase (TIGR04325 family)